MLSDYNPGNDPKVNVVILWRDDANEVGKLKIPALKSLIKQKYINKNDYVTGMTTKPGTVAEHLGENSSQYNVPQNDVDVDLIDLRRNLHTMNPLEKKEALNKLCIKPNSKKCNWAMALAKIGATSPYANKISKGLTFNEWLKKR
jgi:hypothetical protein